MTLEILLQWAGGLLAFATLGLVLLGIWRGTQRKAGLTTGLHATWLRSPWFYLVSCMLFFSIACLGWISLPLTVSPPSRTIMVLTGAFFYFPGMVFALWGRLALGKNYFVSTGFGAQLFSDHQLITSGPFAIVRHPMYAGLMLASVGALLLYFTWTTLFFVLFAPLITLRARREEHALAIQFGERWRDYCKRVPMFIPRVRK